MAVRINKLAVSLQQRELINNHLTIVPKSNNFYTSKFSKKEAISPIVFYLETEEFFILPYLFACSLFQQTLNLHLPHRAIDIKFTGTLLENQVPVINEAIVHLQQRGTTSLCLPTGFGKTVLAAYLTCQIKLVTVILVTREILAEQWMRTFTEKTSARVWLVDNNPIPAEIDVLICMDTRTAKISENLRCAIGLLVIDEAHDFCTRGRVNSLLTFEPRYVIVETATPVRDDGMYTLIEAMVGTHAIFRNLAINFEVKCIVTNVVPEENFRYNRLDYSRLVNSTLSNDFRDLLIISLIQSLPQSVCLVLTARTNHAETLCQRIRQYGISADFLCGTKKSYENSRVLLGTTSKIGTGFDQANSAINYDGVPFDIMIMACTTKKEPKLIQYFGRVFRCKNPTIYYLLDCHRIYDNHWRVVEKWTNKVGGKISYHHIANTTNSVCYQQN
jgi:superfamily II DNA or RNA helicase